MKPLAGATNAMQAMHAGQHETIAAIATARGRAALAVLRVSGAGAVAVVSRCFRGADLSRAPTHSAHVGWITTDEGEDVDQVVVTLFRGPNSVTGEDVVEVSCHGGDLVSSAILRRLIEAGARLAEPGEFTQRSFLNGKMDLAQAEAVADLIHASSTLSHRISLGQLRGRYSAMLERLREELLDVAAFVELELDFSEEDVAFADQGRLSGLLAEGEALVRRLLTSYRTGSMVREGVRVVIAGRPNAGKSTLLNALVGYDRAIVSEHPGTTRDEVDAEAEIEDVRFVFTDTAGLRATADAVEAEGVARAQKAIDSADLVLYLFDLTQGLAPDEVIRLNALHAARPDLPIIVIGNKRDLAGEDCVSGASTTVAGTTLPAEVYFVSAREAQADERQLQELVHSILRLTAGEPASIDASAVVTNERHRMHLEKALGALEAAAVAVRGDSAGDTLAIDLRYALEEIGAITGAITSEDVLDRIFSRFCIGK